jgi:F-type H+-transporting ATPase subunit b
VTARIESAKKWLAVLAIAGLFFVSGAPAARGQGATKSEPPVSGAQSREASNEAESTEKKETAEKDENAEFKESASVRFLARKLGMKPISAYWIAVILNFAVVAGAIFFLSRMHLPTMFRNRTESIRKAMDEAQKASAEARQRLSDIEARLGKLDTEIAGMRSAAEKDAAAEEERIRAAAEEDKKKIVESAEQEIAAAAKTAQRDLKAFAAELAVSLAQKRITVDDATDRALVKTFADRLGSGKDGH